MDIRNAHYADIPVDFLNRLLGEVRPEDFLRNYHFLAYFPSLYPDDIVRHYLCSLICELLVVLVHKHKACGLLILELHHKMPVLAHPLLEQHADYFGITVVRYPCNAGNRLRAESIARFQYRGEESEFVPEHFHEILYFAL